MSYQSEKFLRIADNIRACTKTDKKIKPSDFANKVFDVYSAGRESLVPSLNDAMKKVQEQSEIIKSQQNDLTKLKSVFIPQTYSRDSMCFNLLSGNALGCVVYGSKNGVGDLVLSGENDGKYKIDIKTCGKNLIKAEDVYAGTTAYSKVECDGRNCIKFVDSPFAEKKPITFKPNTQYTVSFDAKITHRAGYDQTERSTLFAFHYEDGTSECLSIEKSDRDKWLHCVMTSNPNRVLKSIGMTNSNWEHWCYIDIDTFQFEEGLIATEYEAYDAGFATVYLDAPLYEGESYIFTQPPYVKSGNFRFECLTNVNPSKIELTCYAKTYAFENFWDNFQSYGKRENYSYAFANWNEEMFFPKYNIAPTTADGMFFNFNSKTDLVKLLEECKITLDFSKCTSFDRFLYNSNIIHIGTVDTTASAFVSFEKAQKLDTIDTLILKADGSQTLNFSGASSIKNITIEGVIGTDVDISQSPLSKESITSIISALSDTTSELTLTLLKYAVDSAFDTNEWSTLSASKANWNILLV